MNARAGNPLAPSSTLALYLCALIAAYIVRDPAWAIGTSISLSVLALLGVRMSGAAIPRARWRGAAVFVAWVFVMKVALDLAGGSSVHDTAMLMQAVRQAARVCFLVIGALAVVAVTPARSVVEELETTRLPRSARLLVMMLVQYPRVLRDRYDQIVEAQVARGADRPRSIVQRISHGVRVLLPVMQSELNAVGDRASLMHLRGLDVDVRHIRSDANPRTRFDVFALCVAVGLLLAALGSRVA